MTGCEVDAAQCPGADGSRTGVGAQISRDTTVFRSGLASFKFDSGASNQASSIIVTAPTVFVDGVTYYFRGYMRTAAAPGSAVAIANLGNQNNLAIRLRTDGGLELAVNTAAQGSPSASVADSSWHLLELKGVATATTTWAAAEVRLDGVSVATWSGSLARAGSSTFGWAAAPGASTIINWDDVAINDSTGANNNTWCGAGVAVLLKPTADSAVGTGWTLGTGTAISGGTAKTAVSNTPPLGVADLTAGSDPKQIRNAASNANSSYDATMTTYTAAGVGASDTIKAVQCWTATGAPSATTPKQGTVGIVSNPAVTNIALLSSGTFESGGGIAGTYGTQWHWSPGTMTETPSVTKGTAPVMRITQVTASTLVAMVCAMFIYVDYTPAAVIPDVGMALTVT